MTADLVQFLRDRLDEDEKAAARAANMKFDHPSDAPWERARLLTVEPGKYAAPDERHIARHDPARVLSDIEAKREVVKLTERAHDYEPTFTGGFFSAMEDALRLFAVAYADHPDYREEWRP